jgi:hypothetical protein
VTSEAREVRDLLDALHEGTVSLEDVALRFRQRSWPWRRPSRPATYLEMAAAELLDPDPYLPGSFDDVVAAYDAGTITRDQFRVLAQAVATAPRADLAAD